MAPVPNPVFEGVVFYLTGQVSALTEARLRSGGGRKVHYLSSLVTHAVVGKLADMNEVEEAEELLEVPVVSEEWVRLSSRCELRLPVSGFRVSEGQIFSRVVARVEGLTRSDAEKVWAMLTWYGGRVVTGDEAVISHQISGCCLTEDNIALCVTPDWVIDSVKSGRRLDELLYSANRVLVSGIKRHSHVDSASIKYSKHITSKDDIFLKNCLHNTEPTSTLKPQKIIFPREWSCEVVLDRNGNTNPPKPRLESIAEDILEDSFSVEEKDSGILSSDIQKLETNLSILQLSSDVDGEDETYNTSEPVFMFSDGPDRKTSPVRDLQFESQLTETDPEPVLKDTTIKEKTVRRRSVRLLEQKSHPVVRKIDKQVLCSVSGQEVLKGVEKQENKYEFTRKKGAEISENRKNIPPPPQRSIIKTHKRGEDELKVVIGEAEIELVDYENFDSNSEKNKSVKLNKRRSVRLMTKAKMNDKISNRRRSIRLNSGQKSVE